VNVNPSEQRRARNPFHDLLITELIEDPDLYRRVFSTEILVGEALEIFRPSNVIITGPQGAGKTMLVNLVRLEVLARFLDDTHFVPVGMDGLDPFLGISVNLVRADFHSFGKRSIARARGISDPTSSVDSAAAADFLNTFLFREYLRAIKNLLEGPQFRFIKGWLGLNDMPSERALVDRIASWECWHGFYGEARELDGLVALADKRLCAYTDFLNTNTDDIPDDVWKSKSSLGAPLHECGKLLRSMSSKPNVSLFTVVDQYEVLPELNRSFGSSLQRIVNSAIKARDPFVFYKIGARTYDWGTELRIWGAESRVEVNRDYAMVDLRQLLMRSERNKEWLFRRFAKDVTDRRLNYTYGSAPRGVDKILGMSNPSMEAKLYVKKFENWKEKFIRGLPLTHKARLETLLAEESNPLEIRLASAWALQKHQRGWSESRIMLEMERRPWIIERWWRKERIEVALLQIASLTRQRKLYFGWDTLLGLSGFNITATLLVLSEIWDLTTRLGVDPLSADPVNDKIQTESIHKASQNWAERDRTEIGGGQRRFEVIGRLGPAIHDSLVDEVAISNPGHSGFSIRERDLQGSQEGEKVGGFLRTGVSWAILEQRAHTSKNKGDSVREKWYLHPMLSPFFKIPAKRVKEPFYVTDVGEIYKWIFSKDRIQFGVWARKKAMRKAAREGTQMSLEMHDDPTFRQ
jgi:hypothetical protein